MSDEAFASIYGVTERQAIDYYTYALLVRRNERKLRDRDKMFRRYVKAPLQTERLRLDTLIVDESGTFIYNYVQTIATRPKLRKVDIRLSGEVMDYDKTVYGIPESDPLSFYISSLTSFVDGRERYLDRVISRRVDLQEEARLVFAVGEDAVREELADNRAEIGRIREALKLVRAGQKGALSKGGMDSKLRAVKAAVASGIDTYIANGRKSVLAPLLAGKPVGTFFPGSAL